MKTARIIAAVVVLIFLSMVISMLSCGGGGSSNSLEGTWTLTTTSNSLDHVGNGNYTLTFIDSSEQLQMDFYSGEGLIEDEPYIFRVQVKYEHDIDGNIYYLFMSRTDEAYPSTNKIECSSPDNTISSASGQYIGEGTYWTYGTGTFNTMRQE